MSKIGILKKLLTPYQTEHIKQRYGVDGDGGYVLSETLLNKTKNVYSLGISDEFTIDVQLSDKGLKVYQYDVNPCAVPNNKNLSFKQLYIDAKSLNNELLINGISSSETNLLLMDIEGGEYDVVLNDLNVINHFGQICMEVHYIFNNENSVKFFERLNENFTLVHIHANNWSISEIHEKHINGDGLREGLADILELTYIKNDFILNKKISDEICPTKIDFPNYKKKPDIEMSWWINK